MLTCAYGLSLDPPTVLILHLSPTSSLLALPCNHTKCIGCHICCFQTRGKNFETWIGNPCHLQHLYIRKVDTEDTVFKFYYHDFFFKFLILPRRIHSFFHSQTCIELQLLAIPISTYFSVCQIPSKNIKSKIKRTPAIWDNTNY